MFFPGVLSIKFLHFFLYFYFVFLHLIVQSHSFVTKWDLKDGNNQETAKEIRLK